MLQIQNEVFSMYENRYRLFITLGLVTAGPAESEDWVAGLEDGMEEGSVP